MSLINKMLKDLEQRQNKNRGYAPFPMPRRTPTLGAKPSYIFVAGILLVLFLCFAWLLLHEPKQYIIPVNKELKFARDDRAAIINSPWTQQVDIKEIALKKDDKTTILTIALDHPALYHLNTLRETNNVNLIIENAKLESDLSNLDFTDSAILNVNPTNKSQGLELAINLNPQIILKDVNMEDEQNNPKLVLTFTQDSSNEQMVTNTIVKTVATQTLLTEQYEVAIKNIDLGRNKQAISELTNILKENPNFKEARTTLAALYMSMNKLPEADKLVAVGLNSDPDYLPFVELRARLLTAANREKEALALLQSYSPPLEDNPQFHALMAALYARNNDNAAAGRIYRNLINLDPQNGSWWFGLGIALEKSGQNKSALEAYSRAISEGKLDPESAMYAQSRLQAIGGDHS